MSVPRALDSTCDLTVQHTVSTLHIPASHTFIPFQQFSISDGSGIRNPADDNNNKTAVPVVSVVTAVSGLCPTMPVVTMQQSAQLGQAVVAPNIIPAVVTSMAVQTASCLTPTTAMTVAKTLNISNHIPVSIQHQPVGISAITMTPQTSANPVSLTNRPILQNTQLTSGKKSANNSSCISNNSPVNNSSTPSAKPSTNISAKTPSSQGANSEQNEDLVKPVFKDGELVLEVECGQNKAILYLSKLCQGSKGPCISFQSSWLTPNEFQFVSGRETAKDWKRSIRHHGKSLKLLLAKGILNVHPTMCDCDGCRQGATLTRKGEKRRIPNGERKPRKPSSNSSNAASDGSSTTAFRSAGSSSMAAHSGSPGAAQAKPDVRRSAVDKPKMADTTASSLLSDISASHLVKLTNTQRPSSLSTSRDVIKPVTLSTTLTPTSPLVPTPSGGTASVSPISSLQLNSTSIAFTPCAVKSMHAVATLSASIATHQSSVTHQSSNSFMTTLLQPNDLAAPASPALAVPLTSSEQRLGCSSSSPITSHVHSPDLPSNTLFHNQTSSVEEGPLESSADITDENSVLEADMSDQDDDRQFGNESDGSQTADEKSDDFFDESDDEQSDKSCKGSDNNDCMSDDDQVTDDIHERSNASDDTCGDDNTRSTDLPIEDNCPDNTGSCANTQPVGDGMNSTSPAKISPGSALRLDKDDKHDMVSDPALSVHATLPTLAVSAFPGTCSQPLAVVIPSSNVKSEHIWVPPRLSPQEDAYHIQRTQNDINIIGMSPTEPSRADHDHFRGDDRTTFAQSKDTDKNSVSRKIERPSQVKDMGHANLKVENIISGKTPGKEFQSIERYLMQNGETDRSRAKGESGHVKQAHAGYVASDEKSIRDREREERHRQKFREERSRKEREERNRKDRERDERREDKEAERRRQEEKDRREVAKAQAESTNPNKEGPTTMEPSRRPPGGVAEAAAFSDYMRMLAAGHGHTFMSPALSYMPSLLPFRHQEASIPAHFLHPMSAFGPQLSGLPKDPMLYQTAGGFLANYGTSPFGPGHLHSLLQRPQYATQQSLIDYQRSLTAAAVYQWPTAYPYFSHDVPTSSSAGSSATAAATMASGVKRPSSEIEAAMELSAKRMRIDGRPPEYSSPWDYYAAAASQHQRVPTMTASLPCGLESVSMDRTAEYLRKRCMEYGPQAAAYLSAFPEYTRSAYHCACADHRDDNIWIWSVDDVCKFLSSLDGCTAYSEHFREQRVTGRILALLTSDHLVKSMGMKLGPAVVLSQAVARKLQDSSKMANCEACRNSALNQPIHPMALPL